MKNVSEKEFSNRLWNFPSRIRKQINILKLRRYLNESSECWYLKNPFMSVKCEYVIATEQKLEQNETIRLYYFIFSLTANTTSETNQ